MRRRRREFAWVEGLAAVALLACLVYVRGEPPMGAADTRPANTPDVVMLDQLSKSGMKLYDPVPFAHGRHAQMAEMWDGCVTCHHHTPDVTTAPATQTAATMSRGGGQEPSQDDAGRIPACRSCHPSTPDTAGIHMPSLKGAYHRQCLNCHREWMDSNACVVCHAARKDGVATTLPAPVPDDIVGRMHQPIPEPKNQTYLARYTPVAGPNVLFRHEEHTKGFGIKCVTCHRRDNCADCHAADESAAAAKETTTRPRPLRPGRTWRETHGPCVACHQTDRCGHCHYQDGKETPSAFDHQTTGQTLDGDHVKLGCGQCHEDLKVGAAVTCVGGAGAACHKRTMALPKDRPGPYTPPPSSSLATTRASKVAATGPAGAATAPTTRPVIIRIRRGGS